MKYLSCKLTGIDKIISKLQYIKSSMTGAVFHGNVISLVAELENLGDNQSGNQKP
jgi:hypothetical protein